MSAGIPRTKGTHSGGNTNSLTYVAKFIVRNVNPAYSNTLCLEVAGHHHSKMFLVETTVSYRKVMDDFGNSLSFKPILLHESVL